MLASTHPLSASRVRHWSPLVSRIASWRYECYTRSCQPAAGTAHAQYAPTADAAAADAAELAATPHEGMTHPRLIFPHTGDFKGPKGRTLTTDEVTRLLSGQVSEQRLARLQQVVADRCYSVVPVIEGLHDVGNMSAVCRSADALGLGAVHCVVNGTKYKQSQRTTAGAEKWLDVKVWTSTNECLGGLKKAGYQIVTTHLSDNSVTIQEIDWTRPTAFVLGNERDGVSQEAVDMADAVAVIPMTGFVESFNVSVAAALIMWETQQQRQRRMGYHGDLSDREREVLLADFLIRGVREPAMLIEELINRGCLVFDRQQPVTLAPSLWQPKWSWKDWVNALEGSSSSDSSSSSSGGGSSSSSSDSSSSSSGGGSSSSSSSSSSNGSSSNSRGTSADVH